LEPFFPDISDGVWPAAGSPCSAGCCPEAGAAGILMVMLALTAVQSYYVEPRAAAIKREIVSFETTPKDHPLRKEFSKLHGVSAVCNLIVLGGGVVLVLLL